jgi:hypothetical protein
MEDHSFILAPYVSGVKPLTHSIYVACDLTVTVDGPHDVPDRSVDALLGIGHSLV